MNTPLMLRCLSERERMGNMREVNRNLIRVGIQKRPHLRDSV